MFWIYPNALECAHILSRKHLTSNQINDVYSFLYIIDHGMYISYNEEFPSICNEMVI